MRARCLPDKTLTFPVVVSYPMKAHRENFGAMNEPRVESHPPFLIADHRLPGEPMKSFPLKLPADALLRLQSQADRLRCNKTALGRTLLLRELEALEQATARHGKEALPPPLS